MKYVYVIISEEHDPELDYIHQYSMPVFAFTSIKKAKDQMLKLKELIEQGEWYVKGCIPTKHTIESFEECDPASNWGNLVMSFKVLHSRDGYPDSYTFYSLRRHELNQGYGI